MFATGRATWLCVAGALALAPAAGAQHAAESGPGRYMGSAVGEIVPDGFESSGPTIARPIELIERSEGDCPAFMFIEGGRARQAFEGFMESGTSAEPVGYAEPSVLSGDLLLLGYAPVTVADGVDQVTITENGWPVHIGVSADEDAGVVWLDVKFGVIPERAYPEPLADVLAANRRIGPAYFALDPGRRLHLLRAVPAAECASADELGRFVEGVDDLVRETEPLWRPSNFAARPVSPVEGEWVAVAIRDGETDLPAGDVAGRELTLTFDDGRLTASAKGHGARRSRYVLSEAAGGTAIDITNKRGEVEKGLLRVRGGAMEILFAAPGADRPTDFGDAGRLVRLRPAQGDS